MNKKGKVTKTWDCKTRDGMACIEGSLLDLLGQLAIVPSVVAWLAPLVYL